MRAGIKAKRTLRIKMLLALSMAFAILTISELAVAADARTASRPRGPRVFTIQDWKYGAVTCSRVRNRLVAGRVRRGRFEVASGAINSLKLKIRRAQRSRRAALVAQLREQLNALVIQVNAQNGICNGRLTPPLPTPTPTPSPAPTFTPNPVQPLPPASGAEVSLAPISRAMSREDVRYLLEKAGFGLSNKEEYLVNIGLSQGVDGVVNEFMSTKPESADLMPRVQDWLDNELGRNTTQSPSGQRSALIDLWVHTNNPYAEKMALFLLSVWTVSGDVISDETFRFLFWDYYTRLRNYAYAETNLPQLAQQITQDPLMLLYLNNELNVRGSPNENYARELMELFTLGPTNLDGQANYTETQLDGSGDIAQAAKALTGWRLTYRWIPPEVQVQFRSERHEPGPHRLFAETAYEFLADNDSELVSGIFRNHPNVKYFYAKEILMEYLTPNPPRELIENLAIVIANNNYNLRPVMSVLLKSEAFYSERYRNTLPKNSVEFAVETVRLLMLADGINVSEAGRQLEAMGMAVNDAPSVFWFNPGSWTGPSVLLERQNFMSQIMGDTTAQRAAEPDWTPAAVLPVGAVSTREVINFVAQKMGVAPLSVDLYASIENYMNTDRQYDDTYDPKPYNNLDTAHQRQKGMGVYYLLASSPAYQLK